MKDFALQRLVSSLLLAVMATTYATIGAGAFSTSSQDRKRSRLSESHQCIKSTKLFAREGRAGGGFKSVEDDGDRMKRNVSNRKRNGIIQKDVEKLHRPWTPESRRRYQNARLKKNKRYRYDKKKNDNRFQKLIVSRWRRLVQKIKYPIVRNTVYVLQCENNKYYVGSTKDRKRRYRQHLSKRGGSKWTRAHRPIGVFTEYKRIPSKYVLGMESQVTAEYMYKYGVNNVRGASFCKARDFTKDDLSDLTAFLGHYNQLSYAHLNKELRKVLPDAPRSYRKSFPDPPRVFNTKNKPISTTSKSNDAPKTTTGELPKAVIRSKIRKSKRRVKKKQRALERKKYVAGKDNQTESEEAFRDQVDWTMEI